MESMSCAAPVPVSKCFEDAKMVLQPYSTSSAQEKVTAVRLMGQELPHPEAVLALTELFYGGGKKTASHQKVAIGREAGMALARQPETIHYIADKIKGSSRDLHFTMYALECLQSVHTQDTLDTLAFMLRSKDSKLIRTSFEGIKTFVENEETFSRLNLDELHTSLFTLAFDSSMPRDIASTARHWFILYANDVVVDGLTGLFLETSEYDRDTLLDILEVLITIRSKRAEEQLMHIFCQKLPTKQWYTKIAEGLAATNNKVVQEQAESLLNGIDFKEKLFCWLSPEAAERRELQEEGAKIILGLKNSKKRS